MGNFGIHRQDFDPAERFSGPAGRADLPRRSAEAAGVLQIAARRLLRDFPLHAGVVASGDLVEDDEIETMAVTVEGARLVFLYNPSFVLGLDLDQTVAVLLHELNHVVLGHLTADPSAYPDRQARILAEELTANEFIAGRLPGRPPTLAQYPKLPPDESTDQRYHRLAGHRGKGPDVKTVDDHDPWDSARKNETMAKAVIESAICNAAGSLSPEQVQKIPAALREQVEGTVRGRIRGSDPGAGEENIWGPKQNATVDWRKVLRRFVGKVTVQQPCYHRPPRRAPELVGILPGSVRRTTKPRVMAVVDTSASVDEQMLAEMAAELRRIARTHDVTVVECDAAIQRIYTFEEELAEVHGRGGTDLRPPFEPKVLRDIRPDVIVYFTDSCGPAPTTAPCIPTLWCLTADGIPPAKWGTVVRMAK